VSWTWIVSPLTVYGALAAGLAACLVLFYSAKREMLRQQAIWTEERKELNARLESFRSSLEKLRSAVREPEPLPALEVPGPCDAAVPLNSVQQSKRSQALRMYRRGEPADRIAATLHMPRTEVDLLLKVQKAVAGV